MPRWLASLTFIALIMLAVSVAALLVLASSPAGTTDPDQPITISLFDPSEPLEVSAGLQPLDDKLFVPEFTLTDQLGRETDESFLSERPHVVAFIFTNCRLACPGMTAAMRNIYNDTEGLDVGFVSVSIDPENDTPARLKEYADDLGIDHDRWRFLTGESDIVSDMMLKTMQAEITIDENDANIIDLGDGKTMRNIVHPVRFALVRPSDRAVIGIYSVNMAGDIATLTERIRAIDAAG
ncbi:MAG: SCO family protein [Planctomycetota bacterium]